MTINQPRTLRASQGWQWINQGVRYFLAAKSSWMLALFIVGTISFILIRLLPILQLSLVFILPFIAAGLAMACADIEQGKSMTVEYLLKGFQNPNRMNIFRYGLLIILLMIVAQILSSIILGMMGISNEQLLTAMKSMQEAKETSLTNIIDNPVLTRFFVVSLLTMLPLIIINLLSPIILAFSSYTPMVAIKLSFIAGVKNIPAFFVYGIVYAILITLIIFVLQFFIKILIMIFGDNSSIALIIYMFAFISCVLTLATLSYCSAYVAFKDIFLGETN